MCGGGSGNGYLYLSQDMVLPACETVRLAEVLVRDRMDTAVEIMLLQKRCQDVTILQLQPRVFNRAEAQLLERLLRKGVMISVSYRIFRVYAYQLSILRLNTLSCGTQFSAKSRNYRHRQQGFPSSIARDMG